MKEVRATGVAIGMRNLRGKATELAMVDAIKQSSRESEEIWARDDIDDAKKNAAIAAIRAPEAMRKRLAKARDDVSKMSDAECEALVAKLAGA